MRSNKNFYNNGDFMRHTHGGNIYLNNCRFDFSANINPIGVLDDVKEAFLNSIEKIDFYPDPDCTELKKEIEKKEEVEFNKIICSNGADELIFSICFALRPQNAVVISPCFAEYEQALKMCGCNVYRYVTNENNSFMADDGFINAINGNTDIVFFTNPNNPVGTLYDIKYMKSLIERCRENNVYIVIDECFIDFVENRELYTSKRFNYDKLIILKAFTKFYAIPGLRLGYGIFNSEKLASFIRDSMPTWNVSYPAQMAGIAAIRHDIYKETIDYINKEKDFLLCAMENMVEKIYGHSANLYFLKQNVILAPKC